MSIRTFPVGYGQNLHIEQDTFTRILNNQIYDTEEIRIDRPSSYMGGFEYVGIAPIGAATTDLVWDVVRCTWSSNKKVRMQYLSNISWDDRGIANW